MSISFRQASGKNHSTHSRRPNFQTGLFGVVVVVLAAAVGFAALAVPTTARAAQTVPYTVNLQGRLTDNNGGALADGYYNVKFKLYDAATAGTLKWSEDRIYAGAGAGPAPGANDNRVQVTNGTFSIQLGAVSALSPTLFSGAYPLYLDVELPTPATATCATVSCASFTVGSLTPRQSFASSPYAFNADTLDGIDSSSFAQLGTSNSGSLTVTGNLTTSGGNLQANTVDAATASTALTLGGANATSVALAKNTTMGAGLSLSLQGTNALSLGSTTAAGGMLFKDGTVNNYAVTLNTPALAASYSLSLPTTAPGLNQCLQAGASTASQLVFATCNNYLAKNGNDSSSASYLGVLLSLANTNTGAAGVLSLSNAGTNSALSVTQSGNPTSGQALIFANNTNASPAGNLLDLQASSVSKFSVDATGALKATSATFSGSLNCAKLYTSSTGFVSCDGGATATSSRLEISGHSYVYGLNASSFDTRYTSRLAGMLHAQEINHGISGAAAAFDNIGNNGTGDGGYAQVLQDVTTTRTAAPYLPRPGIGVINYGVNDIAYGSSTVEGAFKEALKTIISRYRASAIFEDGDASVAYAGTWSTTSGCNAANATYCSGSTAHLTTALNSTATITVPADFPGGTVDLGFIAESGGNGATWSICVDNASCGTPTTVNTVSVAPTGHKTGMVARLTGLAAGTHTIYVKDTALTTQAYFDYWQIEAANPPLVLVNNIARIINQTYGTYQVTDALVATFNTDIQTIVNGFDSSVVYVDQDAVINKAAANFSSDNLHPNDMGYALIAQANYKAIQSGAPNLNQLVYSAGAFNDATIGKTFKNASNSVTAFQVQNASGTDVLNVDTTNGRVGVGNNNPASALDVEYNLSGALNGIKVKNANAGTSSYGNVQVASDTKAFNLVVGSGSETTYSLANKFSIFDVNNTAARLTIDTNGNVGIGTTQPTQLLQVNGNIAAFTGTSTTALNQAVFLFNNTGTAGTWGTTNYGSTLSYDAGTSRYENMVFAASNGDVVLGSHANGVAPTGPSSFTRSLVVRGDSGNVGIGTNAPAANLQVTGAQPTTNVAATDALKVTGAAGGNTTATAQTGGGGANITLTAGNGGNGQASATNGTGGNVTLSAGAAGTGGTGGSAGSVLVKNLGDSATAFQVQSAAGVSVFTADTSGAHITLGKASALNTDLLFSNATNANLVGFKATDGTAAYTLSLPSAAPTLNYCLTAGATTATLMQWQDCNAGSANTALSNLSAVAINANLQFDNTADRIFDIATTGAGVAGHNLSVQGGDSGTGAVNGGNLYLQGGATGGTGTTGSVIVKGNGTDSTTAFRIQNAAGTTDLLVADTVNSAVTVGASNNGYSTTTISDDFESNSMSKWTVANTAPSSIATSSAQPHAGTYSALMTMSNAVATATYTLGTATDTISMQGWAYIASASAAKFNLLEFKNTNSASFTLGVSATGYLTGYDGSTITTYTSSTVKAPIGSWHFYRLDLYRNGTTGYVKVYMDGVYISDASLASGNTGAASINRVIIGDDSGGGNTGSYYIDDVIAGTPSSSGYTNNMTVGGTATVNGNMYVNSIDTTATGGNLVVGSTRAGKVIIGSQTVDTNAVLLQLDPNSAFSTEPNCDTTSQGGMYYNTAANAIRSCIKSSWEDVVTTAGLGILLYGVVPDSGSNPGDLIATTTASTTGPCKASWASATTVSVAPCTVYSGGRKVTVSTATTVTISTGTANGWEHVCFSTGGTAGTATNTLSASTASATESANLPTFSPGAPIACVADVLLTSAGTAIGGVYDTRPFTTSQKEFVTTAAAMGLGWIACPSGAQVTTCATTTQAADTLRGVIVASNGSTSTAGPNAILVTSGSAMTKVNTSGIAAGNILVNMATTANRVTSVATTALSATYDANLGLTRSASPGTACTTTASAANCDYQGYVVISLR